MSAPGIQALVSSLVLTVIYQNETSVTQNILPWVICAALPLNSGAMYPTVADRSTLCPFPFPFLEGTLKCADRGESR